MSNLSLPKMTYANLAPKLTAGKTRTLAYETKAQLCSGGGVAILHHGHTIAMLGSDGHLYVTNAGWSSSTTRGRIHTILTDNQAGWSLGQKNWEQVLTNRGTGEKLTGFTSAAFDGNHLTTFNGEPIA